MSLIQPPDGPRLILGLDVEESCPQSRGCNGKLPPEAAQSLTRGRALWRTCESVSAPAFAADAMMDSEEAVGVVAPLDIGEARVV